MLLVSQEIGGQRETTPGQHRHQALVAQGADQAVERHGGDVTDDGTQFQTEPTMGRQQGITGHLRSLRAVPQDEVWQDGEDGFTRRTLDAPDGDATQPDPHIMRMAGQTPTATTGRLVFQLKAEGEDEGEDTLEKRLTGVSA